MPEEAKAFEFSDLAKLYCDNIDIIRTLEGRLRQECADLMGRIDRRVTDYKSDWYFRPGTYSLEFWKRDWGVEAPNLRFGIWFDPPMIAQRRLSASLALRDPDLRKNVCDRAREDSLREFRAELDPRGEWVLRDFRVTVERDYEGSIFGLIQRFMEFAPVLERAVKESKKSRGTTEVEDS